MYLNYLKTLVMKKIITLTAIVSVTLLACNPLKPGKDALTSTFNKADSIPSTIAGNMITHYLDTVLVDHHLDAIVKYAGLEDSDLDKIFKMENITRIRFLTAAYLHTDPIVSRRDSVTVLLQLKQGYHSNYYYYDVKILGASRLCPPPNGCTPF